jgi:single-strand DNA-binding protein
LSDKTTREDAVNVVTLIGNLATDVELKDVGDAKKVANFTLAVDRRGADAGADFFRVTTWNRQAELCARYLQKGRRIALDGRLRSRSWDDADGKRRSAVDVVANSVEFLSGPGEPAETPFQAAAQSV